MYAAGKIPGGFIKRESRPSEAAILAARLTDRPIRPLFPEGYKDDVQVVITVLSTDQENDPDILGTIAASAALTISEIPFQGPVAAVRIGRIDGQFVVNPTLQPARGVGARPRRLGHPRRDHDGRGRRQDPARGRHGRGDHVRPPRAPADHRPPGAAPRGGRQAQARRRTSSPATESVLDFVDAVEPAATSSSSTSRRPAATRRWRDLVEIGAVRVKGGRSPTAGRRSSSPAAPILGSQMHGITDEDVKRRAVAEAEAAQQLLDCAGDALVVGHNVGFDLGFLEAARGGGRASSRAVPRHAGPRPRGLPGPPELQARRPRRASSASS